MAAMELERRQFLKLLGWGGAALSTGCAPEMPDLLPYVGLQENLLPGRPHWFATTCRQCPSGCGVLAKNVDGRVIKLEGNPLHPLNGGKLCPRGQAALTTLYNPDRIRQPMRRMPDGRLQPTDWDQALRFFAEHLQNAGGRIVFLTPLITGPLRELIRGGLVQAGAGPDAHIMYEAFSYESLKTAHRTVFGREALPTYHLDRADFLISLGADFLEGWMAPVEYARRFAVFRQPKESSKSFFVYLGPRQSMTAANADHMVYVKPGTEYLAAAGILRAWLEKPGEASAAQRRLIEKAVGENTVQSAARQSGASEEDLRRIAERLRQARSPLALAGGNGLLTPNAAAAAVAADLLCTLKQESLQLIDFGRTYTLEQAAPAARLLELTERMRNRQINMLLIYDVNPAFTLPRGHQFAEAMRQVPHVTSFSAGPSETGQEADLHLPCHHFLEEWGEYQPKQGITGLVQPAMGPLLNTRSLADILIGVGFGQGNAKQGSFEDLLVSAWKGRVGAGEAFTRSWVQALQQGGRWEQNEEVSRPASPVEKIELPAAAEAPQETGEGIFRCVVYPTLQFHDGRTANSPWLQEMPDPITQITWGGWVEMHPEDLTLRGLKQGDLLHIASPAGSTRVPVFPIWSVPPGTLAIPVGQGHTHYGRFADGLPGNALRLLPDPRPEGPPPSDLLVKVSLLQDRFPVACTSGNLTDERRHFIQQESFEGYRKGVAAGHRPEITPPLPEGYHPEVDVNRPHPHVDYRWSMVIDLDRCIGCGACVVACYAENNVAFVGRRQMLNQREMSWIRVQRYFQEDRRPRWLVMLCQHCDSAPCESVCPVYAPHHSPEGLNNQVYNRCFGTRFCSQNCPYKVRRFNWFTWTRPDPLNMQLNPDVTVRQKGIMEKCSFCIQRIVQAKTEARNAGRLVRDGDFTTACAQTCPTDAIVFGNLLDPQTRVAQLIQDARAYQVLHELNTKTAVVYLKRLTQTV